MYLRQAEPLRWRQCVSGQGRSTRITAGAFSLRYEVRFVWLTTQIAVPFIYALAQACTWCCEIFITCAGYTSAVYVISHLFACARATSSHTHTHTHMCALACLLTDTQKPTDTMWARVLTHLTVVKFTHCPDMSTPAWMHVTQRAKGMLRPVSIKPSCDHMVLCKPFPTYPQEAKGPKCMTQPGINEQASLKLCKTRQCEACNGPSTTGWSSTLKLCFINPCATVDSRSCAFLHNAHVIGGS